MRKIVFILFTFVLFSCEKNDDFPRIENITKGGKWNLTIGSTPEKVYEQLQQLSRDKDFRAVGVVYRKPYSKPEDIRDNYYLYDAITLVKESAVVERALIQFNRDKITSIETGSALLDETSRWPNDAPDETALYLNDSTDKIYEKLLAIYQLQAYKNYRIILPDKPLAIDYDPDMSNYDEWGFSFSEKINNGLTGNSSVRLYFKNKKLTKIKHEYKENIVQN